MGIQSFRTHGRFVLNESPIQFSDNARRQAGRLACGRKLIYSISSVQISTVFTYYQKIRAPPCRVVSTHINSVCFSITVVSTTYQAYLVPPLPVGALTDHGHHMAPYQPRAVEVSREVTVILKFISRVPLLLLSLLGLKTKQAGLVTKLTGLDSRRTFQLSKTKHSDSWATSKVRVDDLKRMKQTLLHG